MYYYDYHVHTTNSTDGKDTLMDVCQSAISKGVKEIAITDHFEPTQVNQEYVFYQPELFFKEIEEARQIFKGLLVIKYGVELGQPHIYPIYSEKLINEYPFDFVLASAHKIKGDVDFGDIDYTQANRSFYMQKYIDSLYELVQWGKFDCLAHFDLIKRYCARSGIKINLIEEYEEKITEILKEVIKKGKGIEVNTSGLRQYSAGLMPDWDILSLYKKLGGTHLTIGSDAHSAPEIGAGFQETVELLKKLGYKTVTLYKKRKPYEIAFSEYTNGKSA
ncbi:histidinol-phosphatase HisJ family protein [Sinanaerobacter sp. ZZT-01]|uniref:histidinol-phosphatase HisJ family protein n=1 Tax=Sinanaerobacter sp. ZZT-01 TaxID=3111540 RepID=UPI002D777DBE|nr:histidinol-phosphatase HisJ family protein [Sinanaerobacter sp. ZZT-01]WRR93525.1 histidinol-phosphatase HisJ family protein [Sinanaerobacter sp. ZZT-01]